MVNHAAHFRSFPSDQRHVGIAYAKRNSGLLEQQKMLAIQDIDGSYNVYPGMVSGICVEDRRKHSMKPFIQRHRFHICSLKPAFALVVTLSLMILLTVIAVGLLEPLGGLAAQRVAGIGTGGGASQRPDGADARDRRTPEGNGTGHAGERQSRLVRSEPEYRSHRGSQTIALACKLRVLGKLAQRLLHKSR